MKNSSVLSKLLFALISLLLYGCEGYENTSRIPEEIVILEPELLLKEIWRINVWQSGEFNVDKEIIDNDLFDVEGNFREWFSGKVEQPEEQTVVVSEIMSRTTDLPLIDELGARAKISLSSFTKALRERGTKDGKPNICYAEDATGVLRSISACSRKNGKWWIMAEKTTFTYPLWPGRLVFARW